MRVKYIGKYDAMYADFNGKRYVFSKKNRVIDIPHELYDFMKSTPTPLMENVIPYQEPVPVVEKPVEDLAEAPVEDSVEAQSVEETEKIEETTPDPESKRARKKRVSRKRS